LKNTINLELISKIGTNGTFPSGVLSFGNIKEIRSKIETLKMITENTSNRNTDPLYHVGTKKRYFDKLAGYVFISAFQFEDTVQYAL
jgi:hypothetical protein